MGHADEILPLDAQLPHYLDKLTVESTELIVLILDIEKRDEGAIGKRQIATL